MKDAIKKWNVWWWDINKLKETIGIERFVLSSILKLLESPHIKDIIGVRRVGKTVLMYQVISYLLEKGVKPDEILYLNFDDPELNDLQESITISLELNPGIKYVFLDEIQNIKDWEKIIRVYYDQKRFEHVFVSGSSASLISRDVGRILTGRHITTIVTPFSYKEILSFRGIDINDPRTEKKIYYLEKYILEGAFPETIDKDPWIKTQILTNTYNDIISKDVIIRFDVDPEIVKKICYFLMTNIGSEFSYNSIAKSLNIHYDTVKKYVPFFEEVFLIKIVPFFSWKTKIQLKKNMKCYAIDTGLRNTVAFKFSKDFGKLAESVVAMEFMRRNKDVYFWKGKKEVDFVVKDKNKLQAINVTFSDKISMREKEGLKEFKSKYKNSELMIITKNKEGKEEEIKYVPLWKWLLG
ncbi:MAG: ATP-binding protein [Nanoarchaeota archaeon]|nr:ATP-binding protein [Nanoarchaeota archaeon]